MKQGHAWLATGSQSRKIILYIYIYIWLVVWNIVYFSIYWEQSSQLTNIFQRGGSTTNQYTIIELG